MVNMAKFVTLAVAAAVALSAGVGQAEAAKKKYKPRPAATACKAPLLGVATGQGLFGKGTAQAKAAARYDWESKATNAYGDAYGNFDKSRGKNFDCKKGAILKAKCSVVSRPCI
jgi:hypothetical protein